MTKKQPKKRSGSKQLVIPPQGGMIIGPSGAEKEVKIGGKVFKMKRLVTLPLLKHAVNEVRYLRIDVPFYRGRAIDEKKGAAMLTTVTDLTSNDQKTYIVSAVLQKNLEEQYPDNGYVGKSFAIAKYPPPEGKRYSLFNIAEIEED